MIENNNYNSALDYILNRILECQNKHLKILQKDSFVTPKTVTDMELVSTFKLEKFEIDLLIYELINNKYVTPDGNLTLKGVHFIKTGGYSQQKKEANRYRTIEKIRHWTFLIGIFLVWTYLIISLFKGIKY